MLPAAYVRCGAAPDFVGTCIQWRSWTDAGWPDLMVFFSGCCYRCCCGRALTSCFLFGLGCFRSHHRFCNPSIRLDIIVQRRLIQNTLESHTAAALAPKQTRPLSHSIMPPWAACTKMWHRQRTSWSSPQHPQTLHPSLSCLPRPAADAWSTQSTTDLRPPLTWSATS